MSSAAEPSSASGTIRRSAKESRAQAAAPFLPSDILSDMGRIYRASVQRWAPVLAKHFLNPAHDTGSPKHTYDVSGLANNASLLFALAGEPEFAEAICEKQLAWLHRRMRNGEGAHAASLAIQPWVNIGRLYRQRGERDRALAQFAAILPSSDAEPLSFGAFRLAIEEIQYEDVELLYVLDSLRTFHIARDAERGLRFLRSVREKVVSDAALARLDEYEYQFQLARGRRHAASNILDRPTWGGRPHLLLVNAFYRCIVLEAGKTDMTNVVADLMKWACQSLGAATAPDHSVLRYALDLARFVAAKDVPRADTLIKMGYHATTRFEDVPLRFEFSKLAAHLRAVGKENDLAPPHAVLAASNHAGFARRHGLVLSLSSDARAALEDLRAAVRTVLW